MRTSRTITLPEVLAEEIEKRARKLGISIEECLFDTLLKELSPNESYNKYLEEAQQLLEQAKEELKKQDLRQASEKIWGACALAIKAHAMARKGIKPQSHKDLWMYKEEAAKELGNWIKVAFRQANLMHVNFYEDMATREDVEEVLKEVEKLVKTIKETLKTHQK